MLAKIGLGGGCHWCTEGIFVSLQGVEQVEQGWIAALPPDDNFSEAVIVHFDSQVINANDLITIHLETHASSSNHSLRSKYRSAIYAFSPAERERYQAILNAYEHGKAQPLITRVLQFVDFRRNEEKYQDYFRKNPDKPFCRTYISPKLERLRKERPALLK